MLLEFRVSNFRSFKNEIVFSMEKGIGEENISNICRFNNENILKTAALYGANASGKSNLIKAFTAAIMIVRNSSVIPVDAKWDNLAPFMLDEKSKGEPTFFSFLFIANKIKYKYCFTLTSEAIISESLDAYYSQKPTNIFTRTNIDEYKFLSEDYKTLKDISTHNTANKLFLTTATTWNYAKTKDVFLWFLNTIDTYDSFNSIADDDLISYRENDSLKTFALTLLKETDLLIKDIRINCEEKDMDMSMMDLLMSPNNRGITRFKSVNIEIDHEIELGDGNKKTYTLNMKDESSGTRILFALAPALMEAFSDSRVIIVDELEKSLHPALVEFLISTFNNPKINKANSQLIFTTHAVNLLNLDLFRRDQIWFAEKNPEDGVTDIYPLDDFSVRKEENIQKGYINGRYGAIPFIKNGVDLWRE